ncbi:hypothetical protein [Brunnivagina elsteri]|uniref:hypothetical protein n=1 Tax=Brunnivagina elsteri TaxID=1247191 RepID=UPI001B80B917|nr:hypothetical protein [Calothrix elsteri]
MDFGLVIYPKTVTYPRAIANNFKTNDYSRVCANPVGANGCLPELSARKQLPDFSR